MEKLPEKPRKRQKNISRWAIACCAYAATVGASVAAAATLVSETLPLMVTGL